MRGQPDDPDVEALRESMEGLQVVASRAKLYGEAHPQTRAALLHAHQRLERVLDTLGPVTVTASSEGLLWKGRPVSDERDDRVGIGRHMHQEGISQVTFSPGVTQDEIEAFAAALRVNLSLPENEEETLESLLWQAELRNISFRAIAALMEAEAMSGRADDGARGEELARRLVELQDGDRGAGRSLRARQAQHGADVADRWGLEADLDIDRIEDDEWRERFVAEAGGDGPVLETVREGVRDDRASQLLARATLILLRAAAARCPEVPPELADRLLVAASRQLYSEGDAVGLLDLIEGGHGLAESLRDVDGEAMTWVRDQLRRLYSPIRVARMLRSLRPTDPKEAYVLERFLAILPDNAVLTLFDGMAREDDVAAYEALARHVVTLAGERIAAWLDTAGQIPAEQLVPIVHLARASRDPELAKRRAACLRHPAGPVREAALDWYMFDLPPEDARLVAAALLDRAPAVRDAATRVLSHHRPTEAVQVIQRTLQGESFASLDTEAKSQLCVAYGRIAGPTALPVLTALFNTRTGLFRDDATSATIEAAALGIAAVGTANALRLLETAGKGFMGARKAAAQIAIAVHESQRAAGHGKADGRG